MKNFTSYFNLLGLVALLALSSCKKEIQPSETAATKKENVQSSKDVTIATLLQTSDKSCSPEAIGGEILGASASGSANPSNPLAFARSNARFSILTASLARTGLLNDLMKLDGVYTLFAPTDDAFAAAGLTVSAVNRLPKEDLSKILRYHVLGASILAKDVPANAAVPSLSGKNLYVRKNANGVFINLAKVSLADVQAKNGVVHVIDKVLLPPTQSIAQVVVGNPDFKLLKQAVVKANLAGVLGGPGNFTVFAPTNAGFAAENIDSAAIAKTADSVLVKILLHHVIGNAAVFSIDLTNNATPTMLSGGTTTITLSGAGAFIKGKPTQTASKIVATDIITTNGVIHVIDRILLP